MKNDDKVAKVGKGIMERVDDLYEWFKWPDLIFYADNTLHLPGGGEMAQGGLSGYRSDARDGGMGA